MIEITDKEYRKIKTLEKQFYYGVAKYCNDLQDTWDFENPFEKIMEIIDNARRDK